MLASPIIEGTLPAFYMENGIATLAIPFSRSRAVSDYEISGFRLKIKNIQDSDYILTLSHSRYDSSESIVYFDIIESEDINKKLTVGSFYKVQLAYVDKDDITGYYSTVGIIKYTTKPTVTLLGLNSMKNNSHQYSYTGVYSQKGKDYTEKAYSYRFIVKNSLGVVVEDTSFITHNHSTDTNQYESQDVFLFSKDLPANEKYSITYIVRTNNGLEISSPSYKITTQTSVVSSLINSIKAVLDYDNGYVKILLEGEKDPETGFEKLVKGSFMLSRTSEKTNYLGWETINCFNLTSQKPSTKVFKDFAIEQGVKYKYCIQQYNRQNLFSQKLISDPIYVDFEDSFLYDGEKQLKIRFNPKVSSFKKNLLESKVDTIGSQYPFIFKNGNVEYREFPISGLISRLMDEQNLFKKNANYVFNNDGHRPITEEYVPTAFPTNASEVHQENTYNKNYGFYYIKEAEKMWKWTDFLSKENKSYKWNECKDIFYNYLNQLFILKTSTVHTKLDDEVFNSLTDEISSNIYSEREFKLEVLDWLTNGQPKLFKSPNEGNYLVRLMNVSLTPQDQLGRMLHNFSCTAYEIDAVTYDTMVDYNIINVNNNNGKYLKIVSVPLQTFDANWANLSGITFEPNPKRDTVGPYYAQGNLLQLNRIVEWATLEDMEPGTKMTIDGEKVVIGANGKYHIPMSVAQISLDAGQKSTGVLTYAYYGEINDSFSQVIKTNVEEVIGKQVIGKMSNVLDKISNEATQITSFYNARFIKRPIQECYLESFTVYDSVDITSDFVKNYKDNYYKYVILIGDEEYVSAPSKYDAYASYYLPKSKYNIVSINGNLIAVLNENDAIDSVELIDNPIPFVVYHFTKDYSESLKTPLYRKVKFTATEKQDKGEYSEEYKKLINIYPDKGGEDYYLGREASKRTSANKYLMNLRDYYLYRNAGKIFYRPLLEEENVGDFTIVPIDMEFNSNIDFYLREDIDIYFNPYNEDGVYGFNGGLFLGSESYKGFTKDMGLKSILPFEKYTYEVGLNSSETILDLTDKEIYNTGNIDKITSIFLGAGVYAELFYQAVGIEYDLTSNYDLQITKKLLDSYKNKLSKESMIEACINSTDELGTINYINDIEYIYENYNKIYKLYLKSLQLFLKAKEEL